VNLQRLERLDEAIAKIDELLKKDQKNYDAWVTRADFLRDASRFAEAAESYTRAIATIPVVQSKHSVVFYFRGIAYERSNQWEKAESDFRRSLELQPDQPQVLNYLGYSMVDKRIHIPEAMELIRKAVELRPNDGYIVDSLGWAHYQLREYDESVKHLERAVELRPDDPIINDHLGDAYWRAGRKLEAKFQWQHAKDNKPEPADLARIEKKLAEGMPPEAPAGSPTTQSETVKTLN
jgi:tetratricopeptide (TPR) repeat protein